MRDINMTMVSNEIKDFFFKKTCIVTGGTGMIGRFVIERLLSYAAIVKCVSLDDIVLNSNVEYIKRDLADFNMCKEVTSGADCVFHIAGIKGSVEVTKSKPASFLVPLLQMNTNIIEASRQNNIKYLKSLTQKSFYGQDSPFIKISSHFN